MDTGEVIVGLGSAFLLFLGTVVTIRSPKGDAKDAPAVTNEQVAQADTPDAKAFRMMLNQQTRIETQMSRIEALEAWKSESEARMDALVTALKDLARKFRARITARSRGDVALPHTDEDMLEEIEALIPAEEREDDLR